MLCEVLVWHSPRRLQLWIGKRTVAEKIKEIHKSSHLLPWKVHLGGIWSNNARFQKLGKGPRLSISMRSTSTIRTALCMQGNIRQLPRCSIDAAQEAQQLPIPVTAWRSNCIIHDIRVRQNCHLIITPVISAWPLLFQNIVVWRMLSLWYHYKTDILILIHKIVIHKEIKSFPNTFHATHLQERILIKYYVSCFLLQCFVLKIHKTSFSRTLYWSPTLSFVYVITHVGISSSYICCW